MGNVKTEERKNIRGVLFDFDGTLTCPGALDFPAIKGELNCPEDKPILEFLDTQPPHRRTELTKILELREEEAAQESLPNEGAEKCLVFLKKRGIMIGILTRNSQKSVIRVLEKFKGITKQDFAVIITRENSLPKPDPDGVFQAARGMSISTSELMVVGDFRFDIMAGKAAGASTVLLRNRGKSVLAPGDPEPDHTVNSLEEIMKIVCDHEEMS